MKPKATGLVCAVVLAGIAGCSQTPPVPPPTVTTAQIQAPNTAGDAALLTATARVVAVDHANRTVRLRGPRNRSFTVAVGPEVQNFDAVQVGDTVTVHYYESVAYTLRKPGATPREDSVTEGLATAEPGTLPGGIAARRIRVTGLVTGIDMSAHTLDIVDPNGGGVQTIHVTNPERQRDMEAVQVGDTITATITQALAISVERTATAPQRGRRKHSRA
ncbi:MAG: hypothetical protein JOZ42_10335 [Acetobacteraceae bacterium]|nr:hypothetical protein [Acetobacteraceae bacterium]